MPRLVQRILWLASAASIVGVVFYASTKEPVRDFVQKKGAASSKKGGGDQPTPVLAGVAKALDIPVYLEGVGTAKALNQVTVKPQIDGKIIRLAFREGQSVKKGDLLAELDAATYKAQLDQAVAKKNLTEAQLANARRDYERYQGVAKGVVAQKTIDTQEAQVLQFEAQVQSDLAAIASTQAILDYARVLAPIDGRTGLRLVDEGNIIRAGDAGIVVLTQVQPIAVVFTLPQQQLLQVTKAMARGELSADAVDADNKIALDKGALQVIDNQVDQTTGTVRMKAEFPNAGMQLWPGQFVNIRLKIETLEKVVVVPTPAVQRGPNGPFVYVIGEGDRVALRPVTLTQQTDTETVVAKGVEVGETVVTTGFSRLTDGARVAVGVSVDPKSAAPPTTAAPGDGQRKGAGQGQGQSQGKGEGKAKRAPGAGAKAEGAPSSPVAPAAAAATPAAPQKAAQP